MYVSKWSQDLRYKSNVSKKKEKKKKIHKILTTSLKNINTPPYKNVLY